MTQDTPQDTDQSMTTIIELDMQMPKSVVQLLHYFHMLDLKAYLVGGCVRDALLGMPSKDIDVEVYGANYDQLDFFLSKLGTADLVGRNFGVIKFTDTDGNTCDFSVPRRDSKSGEGHRGFLVELNANLTLREAASRRDYTINSLMYDPLTKTLYDFFGGRSDLDNRILRATSSAFSDDALRVLRGMQFISRLPNKKCLTCETFMQENKENLQDTLDNTQYLCPSCGGDKWKTARSAIEQDTSRVSAALSTQYSALSKERVCEEWMKWALRSVTPSRGLEYLQEVCWLDLYPEISALCGVQQDTEYHPEGDVFIHTCHVVDAMSEIADRKGVTGDERAALMFAALGHDFGKATTTELRDKNGVMRWTAHGHEAASGPLMRSFLERIGVKAEIISLCVPLVENHMAHINFEEMNVAPRAVRRLAERLAPANIQQLAALVEADIYGRPPLEKHLPFSVLRMVQLSHIQNVALKPQPPLVLGRHVMPLFNNEAGKHIGVVTKAAYEAQLDGEFSKEKEALEWMARFVASMNVIKK